MPLEPWDFSEQHLNVNHGFDYPECEGGNTWMSTAYFARWAGPLRERDIPYPYTLSEKNGYTVQKHVQQVVFLPERSSKLDNDTIKYFVTQYGAVIFAFKWDEYCYNSSTYSYYYNSSADNYSSDKTKANHVVPIIGWDDNYSKYNFRTSPPGNGAFIGRTSCVLIMQNQPITMPGNTNMILLDGPVIMDGKIKWHGLQIYLQPKITNHLEQ
jgi:C1A family cysteine protease